MTESKGSLARLISLGADVAERIGNLRRETDNQIFTRTVEMRRLHVEACGLLTNGHTTGDHIRDLVICAHGFDQLNERVTAYHEYQKTLKGKQGQRVLVSFKSEVPVARNSKVVFGMDCFRLGVLEQEVLVWGADSITLAVSAFASGEEAGLAQANIFADYPSFDPKPRPLPLGFYVMEEWKAFEEPEERYIRYPTYVYVGDEEVEEFVSKSPLLVNPERYKQALDTLNALAAADPMGR